MRYDVDAAHDVLISLGDLLRRTLAGRDVYAVPLAEEIELTRPYVDIERVRFADRLQVVWEVDPTVLAVRVPRLILQPLVENALHHGIEPLPGPRTLAIYAGLKGAMLRVEVRDDGVGFAGERPGGIGLANTRARLEQHYGAEQHFGVERGTNGGTTAWMEIPIRAPAPPQEDPSAIRPDDRGALVHQL